MKKTMAFILALVLALGCFSAFAESAVEYKNVKIDVNGSKVILLNADDEQQECIIADGQVYMPVQYLIEALGGEYTYDEAANQITISLAGGGSEIVAEEVNAMPADVPNVGEVLGTEILAYTFDGSTPDKLTVEKVVIIPDNSSFIGNYFKFKMLVRNTSGKDLPIKESSMRVWYQYLDADGVVLFSSYETGGYHATVKADQAEWIDMNGYPGDFAMNAFENVATLVIYGYCTTLHGSPDYEFTEPIIINLADFFEW